MSVWKGLRGEQGSYNFQYEIGLERIAFHTGVEIFGIFGAAVKVGHVTRARMTQIMGLLNLAPDIQEAILFLPKTLRGRDPVCAREVIALAAAEVDWGRQRVGWGVLGGG